MNGVTNLSGDATAAAHTRPLAHAIALRLLTAKGADAAGLKGYVAAAGLAGAMVDVLEELTRRTRAMRVEFEELDAARPAGAAASEPAPAPAARPQPQARTQPINPGY